MVDYISGKLAELTPTYAIIDNQGIGYSVEISLQTYDALNSQKEVKVYIQKQINQRDGLEIDYGFASKEERELFRSITSVSGMGASTARMILSSLSPAELRNCIISEDINRLKSIKGIGLKSAQRMVLELKDKIIKTDEDSLEFFAAKESNPASDEALTALLNLGFGRAAVTKAIQSILKQNPTASVEDIIKAALKVL